MSKLLLNKIYNEIEVLSETPPEVEFENIVFDLVDEFINSYESYNYPLEILNFSMGISTIKIATLLNICIWSSTDNGSKQMIETNKWLYSNDELKIKIALYLDYYPENDVNKFKQRLEEIENEFPSLREICYYWKNTLKEKALKEENKGKATSLVNKVVKYFRN